MRAFGILVLTAVVLGLAFAPSPAQATLLLPGGDTGGTPSAYPDPFTGTTTLATTGLKTFDTGLLAGVELIGTYQAWVVTGYASNPFSSSDVTIVYQVSMTGGVTPTGTPAIERLTMASYDSSQTDVGIYSQAVTEVVPNDANRSSSGNVVGFLYIPNNIHVGYTSDLMIVNTNEPGSTDGTLTIQDGNSVAVLAYSPTSVPEPATIASALSGLLLCGLAYARRLRRKVA
jgi:hypothetical protein